MACGIFLDQGWNSCLPHWQADSSTLSQGSPFYSTLKIFYVSVDLVVMYPLSFLFLNKKFIQYFFIVPMACGILVPCPGMESTPPAVQAWNLNHWTTTSISKLNNLVLLSFSLSSPSKVIHFVDVFKEPIFGFIDFLYCFSICFLYSLLFIFFLCLWVWFVILFLVFWV